MRIKKNSKNYVFLNQNSEHIDGYLIHLNKNKTKWKNKTTQNWVTKVYMFKNLDWPKVYVQELRWKSMKKVSSKKT
jgi:hypothetical protein